MFDASIQILVVDDMKTMRRIVQKALSEIGFSNFHEAEDGAKAWTLLSSSDVKIDLVISDWNMPNATGLDLLKRVRATSNTKNLPFLLLTAESEMSQVQAALQAGVDGYVIKPFTAANLKEKLEAVFKKRSAA